MMNNNGLTIGIPVYNEQDRIERAIRCAAPQCEKLIVSDNASTDATGVICQELLPRFPNMEYIRQAENIGARGNWSSILEKTSTPYIMYLGSHDHIDRDYASKVLEVLENDGTVELATGELCFDFDTRTEDVPSYNNWTGGLSHSAYSRVHDFLFDRAHLAWGAYGIFRTASYRKYYTDDLPAYGIDIIFLTRILNSGRFIIVKGTHYYAWKKDSAGEKSDYLERVVARKHATGERLRMRNAFRIAQYHAINKFFPGAGPGKQLALRYQAMVRFGTFRMPGPDPAFYLLYLPVKLARKINRGQLRARENVKD